MKEVIVTTQSYKSAAKVQVEIAISGDYKPSRQSDKGEIIYSKQDEEGHKVELVILQVGSRKYQLIKHKW